MTEIEEYHKDIVMQTALVAPYDVIGPAFDKNGNHMPGYQTIMWRPTPTIEQWREWKALMRPKRPPEQEHSS